MKRPARVRVLGKRITIHYVAADDKNLDGALGISDPEQQRIFILDGLPLENEQDTVLHEVLHIVEGSMGLDLDDIVIQKLATGLLAVIKDSPGFVAYLRASK